MGQKHICKSQNYKTFGGKGRGNHGLWLGKSVLAHLAQSIKEKKIINLNLTNSMC